MPALALVPAREAANEAPPKKRGLLAVMGILEGVEGVEGADEWYEDMQQIVADRKNQLSRGDPFLDST